MNALSLAYASIKSRPLQSALCLAAAAAGTALICAVLLLSSAVEDGFMRNARDIDVVVGAKGSPLQLVLSTVYHADVPTGNIDIEDMKKLARHPQIRRMIPLALGDNYRGWRIVGTTPDYLDNYGAVMADGHVWQQPFDAVAGAGTELAMGTAFAGVHGLSADSDDVHNFHLYRITGVLKPTGTVLDRLILTSVGSVQELHRHPDAGDPDAAEEIKISHQVTALLLKVKSPIATINLPREINRTSGLTAANPGYEMTRLAQSLGIGRDALVLIGGGLIALASLMLLAALLSSLAARRYDLGVLRVLGAPAQTLWATVMAEALLLSGTGTATGLAAGHAAAYAATSGVSFLNGLAGGGSLLTPQPIDAQLLLLGLGIGLIAGAVPAALAARTDIAGLLARGRA